jgi:hypothetical protein
VGMAVESIGTRVGKAEGRGKVEAEAEEEGEAGGMEASRGRGWRHTDGRAIALLRLYDANCFLESWNNKQSLFHLFFVNWLDVVPCLARLCSPEPAAFFRHH